MMQTMTGDNGSDSALKLPSTLDLAAAEEFLATMRARAVGALELDASGVEVITLPCAQIILSAAGGHSQLAIRRPSESFVKAFVDLGLSWPGDQEPVAASEPQCLSPINLKAWLKTAVPKAWQVTARPQHRWMNRLTVVINRCVTVKSRRRQMPPGNSKRMLPQCQSVS
jgi:hypothetical protein